MTNYILNQDGLGYDIKLEGGAPTILAFKKGDKVQSDKIIQDFSLVGGRPSTLRINGIEATPTVSNPNLTSTVFIPLTSLTEVKSTSTQTNTNTTQSNTTKYLITFALLGLVVYFIVKK